MPTPTQVSYNAERAAQSLHACFDTHLFDWNHDEATAISIIERAQRLGTLPQLERAFRAAYNESVHDYVMNRLDCWDSEMGAYARIFYTEQSVADAKRFYDACDGITNNQDLHNLITELAGYDPATGRARTPERLAAMIEVYEACYARHYGGETVDHAVRAELGSTGYFSTAQDLIESARPLVAQHPATRRPAGAPAASTPPTAAPTTPAPTSTAAPTVPAAPAAPMTTPPMVVMPPAPPGVRRPDDRKGSEDR